MISTQAMASPKFRWPWEPRIIVRYHYHFHSRKPSHAEPRARVDCGQILEAVRDLEPVRLNRALKISTPNQKRTIEKCINESK